MFSVEVGQIANSDLYWHESLIAIKSEIGMLTETGNAGWGREASRLLAIDTALLFLRRDTLLPELERQVMTGRLCEARSIVLNEHDPELVLIQNEFEVYMCHSSSHQSRDTWLVAINAMLPNPYRAAKATVESAMRLDTEGSLGKAIELRLIVRLRESVHLSELTTQLASAG